MKKKVQIFYVYNGQELTFGFDETFSGIIREASSGLQCEVVREDHATSVYISEVLSQRDLLKMIIDN